MLYILVEGPDDERFFERIIKPKLDEKHDSVIIRKYAQLRPVKVRNLIQGIKVMNHDYLFVADINEEPCVTAKKQKVQQKYGNIDEHRTMVIRKEVESWYLAGLDHANCQKLGVRPVRTTDSITKEKFDASMPKRFDSRIDFMSEILKCFSIEIAQQKNRSFRYFMEKHDC